MDANGNATHALFTGEAMMVSPARSTASTVIPDIERYPILIEGEPVSSVILIGTVSHSNVRMDHWSFELRDATHMINVSYYNGDYVQVFGKTGMNEYFLQIKAFKIRPIVNYNDTTHHYLYSIYCTLDIRKTNALKAKLKPAASTVFPKRPAITPTEVPMELSTKDKIFTILRDPAYRDIAHGVSLKLIRSALDISQDEIMKVISEQIYLGLIYTTVDDNHFKSSI
uniref:Replication protein A C-terminal domain-containing protein n=1 Tax=Hordeum vulgare subsp. vulgare TaxID=112509 RepID=A0A8I6X1Z1_HORVV